jgi:hypothetical protein
MILPGTPVVPAAIGYLYRQYQRGGLAVPGGDGDGDDLRGGER